VGISVLDFPQVCFRFSCVLVLQRFSAPVWVLDMRFSPHVQHSSMLWQPSCGCESMYRLFFFFTRTKSPEDKLESQSKKGAIQRGSQ
jgi:hypothetical protein